MLQPVEAQNSLFEEVLRLPLDGLCQIALSPNGTQVAVQRFIDTEKQRMELAIYDTQRGERQALLYNGRGKCSPEYGAQNTLAWEGQTLAAVFEEGIMVWEANDSFEQRYTVEGSLFALSTLADRLVTVSFEKRFAAGNVLETFPVLVLRDLDSGRELGRHTVRQLDEDNFFTLNLLAWSPNGQALLASDGYAVRAVAIDGETITPREPTWGAGNGLGLLSWLDDRSVVTGEGTGVVRVWEVADGAQRRELYLKSCGLALSPDQRWLAGFEVNDSPDFSDGIPLEPAVNIFDLLEVKLLAKLPYEMQDKQSNPCLQVTFSADGQYLAAIADEDNPTLYVWARRQ